jgi:hypothetical protein
VERQGVCSLVERGADDRIIPEGQKDGVRQRLLVFLEEPDFAVRHQ